MKLFSFLLVYLISTCFVLSQTKNLVWKLLIGKWECTKVVCVINKDSLDNTKQYIPYFNTYSENLNYTEEFPAGNTSVDGKYKVDKTKKRISFIDMVQTTKYPGAKVKVEDLVFKAGKQSLEVLHLTTNNLILKHKHIAQSESKGDYIFYFNKK